LVLNDNDEPFTLMESICSRNAYLTEDKIQLLIVVYMYNMSNTRSREIIDLPSIHFYSLFVQVDESKAKKDTISEALLGRDYDIKPEVCLRR
jgi:hypothetical protein